MYMQHDLEKSMVELAYLGSLLGMPNILDPVFPLAYTTFFGSLPSTDEKNDNLELGTGNIKVESEDDQQHSQDLAYVHTANVS